MNDFSHKTITKTFFKDSEFQNSHLEEYCLLPDKDENQRCFSAHFYNPVTGQCYRKSYDSAKNRFIYWIGKYIISNHLPFFGRAIHYLEDICTPVHTQYQDSFDAVYRANLHVEFEKGLDNYISENGIGKPICNDTISLDELIEYCAVQSAEIYYQYRDLSVLEDSFIKTLHLAISALDSLMYILPRLEAKIVPYHDSEIVLVKSQMDFLAAILDFNIALKTFDHRISVFERTSEIKNFEFKEIIDEF